MPGHGSNLVGEIRRLVGRKVAVWLGNVETRDDCVTLSEIDDLGSGPGMFCPWEPLYLIRDRPPREALKMPRDREGTESYVEEYSRRDGIRNAVSLATRRTAR